MDIKEIALTLGKQFFGEGISGRITDYAEALVAEIQKGSEPIGWVHVDDVEYDGTTHSLRTINVMPSNFEKWVPIYVQPSDKAQIEQSVVDACAELAASHDNYVTFNAIRSGEWKKFRKGE